MMRKLKHYISSEVGYPIIDHIDHKREAGKVYSYPYPCGKDQFQKLINFCNENKLDFVVGPDNTYNPGSSIEIKIFEDTK